MQTINLCRVPGDDLQFPISLTQNGGILNITGWVIYFIVKRFATDPDSAAVVEVIVATRTSPTTGQTFLLVPGSATIGLSGPYYYQFTLVNNAGTRATFLGGTLTFGINLLQGVS